MKLFLSGPSSLSGFVGVYSQSLRHLEEVADEGASFEARPRTPERLVAAIWFDQQLDHAHLKIADGRKLRVLSPGRWNTGPGPDFQGARLRLAGGAVIDGDVEVHVFSSDWAGHKHSDDPRYSGVILHACMWNDRKLIRDPEIPVVEMFPYLVDERILAGRGSRDYPHASATMRGFCAPLIDRERFDKAMSFIAAAGDSRIERKASRMASMARVFGYDQTLYKGLMEAAGYSANKEPLSHLADLLPLDVIRAAVAELPLDARPGAILALIYGCSGFFDKYNGGKSDEYLTTLRNHWDTLKENTRLVAVRGIRLARTRPANNPYRRMAAVARLLGGISGLKLFDYFLSALGSVENPTPAAVRAAGRRLRGILVSLSDPYWDFHLSPRGLTLAKPQKLIGDGLASIIIVNIIIPLILAYSRKKQNRNLEVFLHQLLCRFGGQSHNALTRFTSSRIFGPDALQPRFATNARLHQGLLQIYYDFCRELRRGCEECDFMSFLVEEDARR
ncbi:MAG TPA: DUF2851 family protein [Acidobacteriota bacterium]|nr:DUF2851 family protein [Acidobacteriota bacterium]